MGQPLTRGDVTPMRYVCPSCTRCTWFPAPTVVIDGRHAHHFEWCEIQHIAAPTERAEIASYLRTRLAELANPAATPGD